VKAISGTDSTYTVESHGFLAYDTGIRLDYTQTTAASGGSNDPSDNTPPTVNILHPPDGKIEDSTPDLNYTLSETGDFCKYNVDNGDNQSLNNCQNTTLSTLGDGQHNVTVWANDTAGNSGKSTRSFSIGEISIDSTSVEPRYPVQNDYLNASMNGSDLGGNELNATLDLFKGSNLLNDSIKMNEPGTPDFELDQIVKLKAGSQYVARFNLTDGENHSLKNVSFSVTGPRNSTDLINFSENAGKYGPHNPTLPMGSSGEFDDFNIDGANTFYDPGKDEFFWIWPGSRDSNAKQDEIGVASAGGSLLTDQRVAKNSCNPVINRTDFKIMHLSAFYDDSKDHVKLYAADKSDSAGSSEGRVGLWTSDGSNSYCDWTFQEFVYESSNTIEVGVTKIQDQYLMVGLDWNTYNYLFYSDNGRDWTADQNNPILSDGSGCVAGGTPQPYYVPGSKQIHISTEDNPGDGYDICSASANFSEIMDDDHSSTWIAERSGNTLVKYENRRNTSWTSTIDFAEGSTHYYPSGDVDKLYTVLEADQDDVVGGSNFGIAYQRLSFNLSWDMEQVSNDGLDHSRLIGHEGWKTGSDGWYTSQFEIPVGENLTGVNYNKTESPSDLHVNITTEFRSTNWTNQTGWSSWYSDASNVPGGRFVQTNTSYEVASTLHVTGMSISSSSEDTIPPSTSSNASTNTWLARSQDTVELTCTDSSGIKNVSWQINGGSVQSASSCPQTVTGFNEGNNTFQFWAWDTEGNKESVNTEYILLDGSNPSVSILDPGNITYNQTGLNLNTVSSDSVSGVDQHEYSKDGNTWQTYTPNTTLSWTDGQHDVQVRATDKAGNTAVDQVYFTVDVDTTAPGISIDSPKNQIYTQDWVILNGSTTESADIEYSLNGGANQSLGTSTTSFTTNLTGLMDTTHVVTVWASDSEGNTGKQSQSFTVDAVQENKSIVGSCPDQPFCHNSKQPVQDNGTTDGDTVDAAWDVEATSSSGTYNMSIIANSTNPNVASVQSEVIKVEIGSDSNSAPNADFSYSPSSPTTVDEVQFTDSSTDSDGSIQTWAWDIDGDGTIEYNTQNPVHNYSSSGDYNVELTVTDNEGATDTVVKTVSVSTTSSDDGSSGGGSSGGGGGSDPDDSDSDDDTSDEDDSTDDGPLGDAIGGTREVIVEVNGSYAWTVSTAGVSSRTDFNMFGYPGRQINVDLILENQGTQNVTINSQCVSNHGACQWIGASKDQVTLGPKEEELVAVKGQIPENASRDQYLFTIRFTDPSYNPDQPNEGGYADVDFTINMNQLAGMVAQAWNAVAGTFGKLTEWTDLFSDLLDREVPEIPFFLVPLVPSLLAFVGMRAIAPQGGRTYALHVLAFVVLFILLTAAIPV